MNLKDRIDKRRKEAEEIIFSYLPKEEGKTTPVIKAMNYSVKLGGKRIRPILMREFYRLFGGEGRVVEPFMAAIEMIHSYSLVHDDLPAMDNDELRRGNPTTHVAYGEAMAILAGDGLLNLATETALKAFYIDKGKTSEIIRALKVLSDKAGLNGMLGGQVVDVDAEKNLKEMTLDDILFIHEKKTACLLESSAMIGAILAGASEDDIKKTEELASKTGTAFQIRDDILDVEGDEEELGKPIGSDERNGKVTYVTIKGLERAKADEKALTDEALEILESFEGDKTFLREFLIYLNGRKK
ncbi:MAG: polyprenyl synthetase family protein [Lachnospiraceae bacterium]|nr:polyprenyl synthetase family protein [Lachnospiraceae bacterium]